MRVKNVISSENLHIGHLGGHHPFLRKLEKQADQLNQKVWICDGAKWIWNWISSSYPESTQILDYFHCSEKLHNFGKEAFKNDPQRNQWTSEQEDLLLNGQADLVIANIEATPCKGKAKGVQRTLLTYYENNLERMHYKKYREEGLLIGSGPMPARPQAGKPPIVM